jgi:hypothetical protein
MLLLMMDGFDRIWRVEGKISDVLEGRKERVGTNPFVCRYFRTKCTNRARSITYDTRVKIIPNRITMFTKIITFQY